jgi:prepilin-type N-terminal cleavage/methylation domain-containing protein
MINKFFNPHLRYNSNSGFTLIETLAVLSLIGVLAAILIPSWLTFINNRSLNIAQSEVYQAMRQAQSQAIKKKLTWQVSLREKNGVVQWAIHEAEAEKFIPDSVQNNDRLWNEFDPNIRIDQQINDRGKKETTLAKHSSQEVWRVLFNYQGCPVYKVGDECINTSLRTLGQITFYHANGGKSKRCVYVSTVLGAMRVGRERTKANNNGKYCY